MPYNSSLLVYEKNNIVIFFVVKIVTPVLIKLIRCYKTCVTAVIVPRSIVRLGGHFKFKKKIDNFQFNDSSIVQKTIVETDGVKQSGSLSDSGFPIEPFYPAFLIKLGY